MVNILVVEDDELLRDIYRDTLSKENFRVETAEDGDVALAKINGSDWDLVLLDIVLPKLSGFDVLRKYRENRPANSIKKIVFLTNLDKQEELQEIKKMGLKYLIKSQLTPGDLLRKVNEFIAV